MESGIFKTLQKGNIKLVFLKLGNCCFFFFSGYMLFLLINVCFVSRFQQLTVSTSSQNYTECLQTKCDNRSDFNINEMLALI